MIRLWKRWFKPRPVRLADPKQWGGLRRVTPLSRVFGFDRGTPIDRRYIEGFLQRQAGDIQGRVLEIGDASYTRRFGAARVRQSDVLHAVAGNPAATLIGDLATGEGIPTAAFDCIILTQTLLCIYDLRSALDHAFEALKPGGVLLATVPGVCQISRYDMDRWGDYWRFTSRTARRLFAERFGEESVQVESHGNVLAAIAMLHGLSAEELTDHELDYQDADYEVTLAVRAQKAE